LAYRCLSGDLLCDRVTASVRASCRIGVFEELAADHRDHRRGRNARGLYRTRRWVDKKSFVSLGLQLDTRSAADALFGFLLSGVMAGTIFCIMLALGFIGNVQVAAIGLPAIMALAGSLCVMALVGFWEELVFRGYILQNMAEGMGMKVAILVSCAIYALVHSATSTLG
jgi:membrane protease YdiL (CAAX protease family)